MTTQANGQGVEVLAHSNTFWNLSSRKVSTIIRLIQGAGFDQESPLWFGSWVSEGPTPQYYLVCALCFSEKALLCVSPASES